MPKLDTYQKITDAILDRMDQGEIPWRQPWSAEAGMPKNIRGTHYRGINVWILSSLGYQSPTFLTYKQAQAQGGNVRKGERGAPVIFWKQINVKDRETGDPKRVPLLRGYTVFNVSQCDGVEDPHKPGEDTRPTIDPIEVAEKITANYAGSPEINYGGGRACYAPISDAVSMPARDSFESSEFFYSVPFHELGHSTGHRSRLARDGVTNHAAFGRHEYAREELVAEFTASYLCGAAGIEQRETLENSAAYLQSWAGVLRRDPKALIAGAAQAQRAADWIQGRRFEKGESI